MVEDSEEHKNAAKSEVVEILDTQTPLTKKNEVARLKTKNSKKNTVKAEVVEDSEEH